MSGFDLTPKCPERIDRAALAKALESLGITAMTVTEATFRPNEVVLKGGTAEHNTITIPVEG